MGELGLTLEDAKSAFRSVTQLPSLLPELGSVVSYRSRETLTMDEVRSDDQKPQARPVDMARLLCGEDFRLGQLGQSIISTEGDRRLTVEDEIELRQLPSEPLQSDVMACVDGPF